MYDVIGDVHGYADALVRLLAKLGYSDSRGCWRHPERTAVFLGDLVDRGPEIGRVLDVVRRMIDLGAARAVMGNHEFNIIAFFTPDPAKSGEFLRPHSEKNIEQCRATLQQLSVSETDEALGWLKGLPLWLDLGGLRVIHACWDPLKQKDAQDTFARNGGYITENFIVEACEKGTATHNAIEVVLKGKEAKLPDGVSFFDKDGNERHHVPIRWYLDPAGRNWREYAFVFRPKEKDLMPDGLITKEIEESAVPYAKTEPPILFGHYWIPGHLRPGSLAANVACLDYSVAKGGRLCAYRWDGESVLDDDKFVSVSAES